MHLHISSPNQHQITLLQILIQLCINQQCLMKP